MNVRMKNSGAALLAITLAAMTVFCLSCSAVHSYPEFQQFVEKNSPRTANCAMCHSNANGPVGEEEGQISKLTPEELKHLSKARAALEPGQDVDSPILNRYGNEIIKSIGKRKFVELKADPGKLPELMGDKSDLDDDGISDSREFLDGTDPLNNSHGDPVKLFWINLNRHKVHVILTIVAVLSINYGLIHLIQAMNLRAQMLNKKRSKSN